MDLVGQFENYCPKKLGETCSGMLIAVLSEMEKTGNKVRASPGGGMNKLRYTLTKASHTAVQTNELDTHTNSVSPKKHNDECTGLNSAPHPQIQVH